LSPADVDRAGEAIRRCDLILLQLEVPLDVVYYAIEFGARYGIETLLNPAPAVRNLDMERIRGVTFLTPNESELSLLTGMPVATDGEIERAARSLLAGGIGTIIVTLGSRGALLVTSGSTTRIAPFFVTPVDTTGAGDAFIGSFAHFYSLSKDIVSALEIAACYAANSITRRGTQKSYASAEDFEASRKLLGCSSREGGGHAQSMNPV
jgi:ribokinase